jgi:hypothetical protein
MLLKVKSFKEFNPINENVQSAKSLLLKNALRDKKRRLKLPPEEKVELTPEEEKRALNNPDYIEVRDYFLNKEKNPGLVGPFTYFRIEEGLPMGNEDDEPTSFTVINLKKKLDEASPIISTFPLPLGNIESYIKKRKTEDDGRSSYEALWDDLDVILSKKPIKTFVDNFVGPIRQEFSKSLKLAGEDPERAQLIDRLYHAVSDIKNLKPLINEVTGVQITAEEQLIKNASAYKDTRTYPEYKDTYVAFKSFVRDCEDKVEGWGTGIDEFVEELRSISPSIKILYYDATGKKIFTSARSGEGMRSLCKIANATFCIRDNSTFWRYTSGSLQISISLLGVPKTDLKYLTSITVTPDGTIKDSANRLNQSIHRSGENYIDFLKRYDIYDEEAVEKIKEAFGSELVIKRIIETIEKDSGTNRSKLIHSLGGLAIKKSTSEGLYSPEEMELFKNLIISILKKDNDISYKETVDAFLDPLSGGFFTMEDIELFEVLSEKKYDKADAKKIYDLTLAGIAEMPEFMEAMSHKPEIVRLMEELLKIHPEIKAYVESNMI